MKRKSLTRFLMLATVVTMLSTVVFATDMSQEDLEEAIEEAIADGGSGIATLTGDVTTTSTINITGTVTLDLAGYDITANTDDGDGGFSVITVGNGTNTPVLTLTDSTSTRTRYGYWDETGAYIITDDDAPIPSDTIYDTFTGGIITGGTGTENTVVSTTTTNNIVGGGVFVKANATFTMTGGNIAGNTALKGENDDGGQGGGVFANGAVTLSGGTIAGNSSTSDGGGVYAGSSLTIGTDSTIKISNNKSNNGAGVIAVTFTMENGTISNNSSTNQGGGVYARTFTMRGGTISGNQAISGGGVFVSTYSTNTFIMEGGTISGNKASNGGGVYVNGTSDSSKATFTMSGGTISGNEATGTDGIYGGGGVYVQSYGVFNMSGDAVISSNTASNGGGVYVNTSGTFKMEGGTIGGEGAGNTSTTYGGGGVYVNSTSSANGTFNMTGGTISYNKHTNSDAYGGGGVYVNATNATSYGTFTMTNATIEYNEAKNGGGVYVVEYGTMTMTTDSAIEHNEASNNGGGVYLAGTLTMTGGSIKNNTVSDYGSGGGVYFNEDGTMNISGDIDISGNTKGGTANNVYLYGNSMTVTGALTGSSIGITTSATASDGYPVTVATGSSYTLVETDDMVFSKDVSTAAGTLTFVDDDATNKIQLVVAHVHTWVYSQGTKADGDGTIDDPTTIVATCTSGTCSEANPTTATLQIVAPTATTYTGSAIIATIDDDDDNAIQGDVAVVYYVMGDEGYALTDSEGADEPVNVGTYKATIKLGSITAYVTYSIEAKEVDVVWSAAESYTYTGVSQTHPIATYEEVGGADVTLTVTIETGKTFMNAATYTFTASETTDNPNYTLNTSTTTASFTIDHYALTLTDTTKVYDGTNIFTDQTITGANSESVTVTVTVTSVNVGDYTTGNYTVTYTVDGSASTNYTLAADQTVTITKAPVTVTLGDTVQTADAVSDVTVTTDPDVTYTVTYGDTETTTVPTTAGTYAIYVVLDDTTNYYIAGSDEASIEAVQVGTLTITEEIVDTYTVTGIVENDGTTPVVGAIVTLKQGNTVFATAVTNSSGEYTFTNVISGLYNIVAESDGVTMTIAETIDGNETVGTITMPSGDTNSVVEVAGTTTPAVVVSGLDAVAENAAEADKTVKVVLTVEEKADTEISADSAQILAEVATDETVGMYLAIDINKTVDSDPAVAITTTSDVLAITIPLPEELQGKETYVVYRAHGTPATIDTITTDNTQDEYIVVSSDKTSITLYVKKFSTYALAYTEYSTSSSSSGGSSTYSSSVASADNGDVSISNSKSTSGTKITITATPDEGYEVGSVTVTYASGREVSVTDNGNDTYSYLQPGAAVTVTVTFVKTDSDSVFTDVDSDDSYYDAVVWAVENGITTGYSDGSFDPYGITNRAQAVTFLWRAMGEPSYTIDNPFTDISEENYFYDAVLWAFENGITVGTTDTTFSPYQDCSRAHIITFLWRMDGKNVTNSINLFTDVSEGNYYYDAVLWGVGEEITTGVTSTTFEPETDCTRVQIVTFLYRYLAD